MQYLDIQSSWNIVKSMFKVLPRVLCEFFLISLLLVFIIELLLMGISIFIPLVMVPLAYLYHIVILRIRRATTKFQTLITTGFPILSILITCLLYESIITDKLLKLIITYLSIWFAYVFLIAICFLINVLTPSITLMYQYLKEKILRTKGS